MWTSVKFQWTDQWCTKYSVHGQVHWTFIFISECFNDINFDFVKRQNQWTIIFFSDVFNDAIFFFSKRQNQWTFTFISEHITDFEFSKMDFFLGQVFTEPSHVHWVNHWKLQFNQCTLHWNKSCFSCMKQLQISFVGSNILLLLGREDAPSSRGKTADLITDHNVEEGSNTNTKACFWLALITHPTLNLGVWGGGQKFLLSQNILFPTTFLGVKNSHPFWLFLFLLKKWQI